MAGRRITLFAVVGALVIALAVLAAMFFGGRGETAEVKLPAADAQQSSGEETDVSVDNADIAAVTVTRENVQAVIRMLDRAEEYYRMISVLSVWQDGNTSWQVETWQLDEKCRVTLKNNKGQRNVLVDGDAFYLWYAGDESCYSGSTADFGGKERLMDEFQMIATYEDVLELDAEDILRAEHVTYGGESCIFVEAVTGKLGYRDMYWISLATGLLTAAQTWDGDEMIYGMQTISYVASTPPEEVFELPF